MVNRRNFLKGALASVAAPALSPAESSASSAKSGASVNPDSNAALVDLALCVGCRKCEAECNKINELPPPDQPFEDKEVMNNFRRPDYRSYTVVNKFEVEERSVPIYVKVQCMHCNDPACVSACIVGAFTKDRATGSVIYDASKCIGCRYCMVACPYQIPAYEYNKVLTPQVRKCTFCFEKKTSKGEVPACVKICPEEAIIFGKKSDVIARAQEIIQYPGSQFRPRPDYVQNIYGLNEVGGSSWMYISPVPFEKLGFLNLPETAPPRLTEAIQHGVFKYFIPPILLFSVLGATMKIFEPKHCDSNCEADQSVEEKGHE